MYAITDPILPAANRPRAMVVLRRGIHACPSCIANEIAALEQGDPVLVRTRIRGTRREAEIERLAQDAREFGAQVLHTHYLGELPFIARLAEKTGLPFTVRTHSSDTTALHPRRWTLRLRQLLQMEAPLERRPEFVHVIRAARSEMCLGVLSLPCAQPWLVRAGIPESKIVECFPTLRFSEFHDRSPNGEGIMNVGRSGSRKARPDFMRLAKEMPEGLFAIYANRRHHARLERRNAELQAGVAIRERPAGAAMLREYKKHRWLVYTGDSDLPAIGWPIAIAEAQAAGVGVCMPRLRPDLAEYVGEGAGVLYDTIDELPGIVAGSVPDEMRERGFEQARKSDIEAHLHRLTDLWQRALALPGPTRADPPPPRQPSTVIQP